MIYAIAPDAPVDHPDLDLRARARRADHPAGGEQGIPHAARRHRGARARGGGLRRERLDLGQRLQRGRGQRDPRARSPPRPRCSSGCGSGARRSPTRRSRSALVVVTAGLGVWAAISLAGLELGDSSAEVPIMLFGLGAIGLSAEPRGVIYDLVNRQRLRQVQGTGTPRGRGATARRRRRAGGDIVTAVTTTTEPLLAAHDVTVRFGGVVALDRREPGGARRIDRRAGGSQRRREDHAVRRALGPPPAARRQGHHERGGRDAPVHRRPAHAAASRGRSSAWSCSPS